MKSLTCIDISKGMLAKAKQKFNEEIMNGAEEAIETDFLNADVESLPFKDETFDVVVDTFSLCVFEKPDVALSEVRRVLKRGGKLLLLEHTKAKENWLLSGYQSTTSGMVKQMAKGCDWSQDVEKLVADAGFLNITWGPQKAAVGLIEALEVTKN